MEYFVLKGHDTTGPFSEEDLRRDFAGQRLEADDMVRPSVERHWTPLRKLLDRLDGIDAPPLPPAWHRGAGPLPPAPARILGDWWRTLGANPLPAGLLGIGLAAVLAFLARWPLLVALPGMVLGVVAGLLLILRNRPLAGGAISLAAILLPIALAPKPIVPAPAFPEIPAALPSAPATATPLPEAPIKASRLPGEPPLEVPRTGEAPAPR